jgi:DNA-binding LytR/AlgR family response regulator
MSLMTDRAANVARPQTEVALFQLSGALFSAHRWQSEDRETLSSLCDRLDPRRFVRVHRSVLINLDRIKEVTVINGEYELVLQGGIRIALSRIYRDEFFFRLGDARPASPNFKKR